MKALLFICVPFIFGIAGGGEQGVSGCGPGREARGEPGRPREFGERLFLELETESCSETWRIISDWGGDQDLQMIRDSRGEKGVGTETEGQTKNAATRLPRVRSLDSAVWVSCCCNSGFPRLSVAPWQRAMTASAGDPKPALPPFTVDLDRAAAPLPGVEHARHLLGVRRHWQSLPFGSSTRGFFPPTFSVKPLSHRAPSLRVFSFQLQSLASRKALSLQDLESYKLGR